MSRRPRFLHWALLAALPLLSGCWYVGAAAAGAILSLGKNGGGPSS